MTIRSTNRLKPLLILCFLGVVLGYAYFRIQGVVHGVKITVYDLENGETRGQQRLLIAGNAKHATKLTINDYPVPVDQRGNFTESLLLPDGYTIITLRAEDKFGKQNTRTYEVVYSERSL